MLGQVLAYGGQHRDEFGTTGLIRHAGDDASVFVAFTTDVDQHREALDEIVTLPDELIVCQAALSDDVARALYASLVSELMPVQAASVGLGMHGVEVNLWPGQEALADKLAQRYGDAVTVTICPDQASCTSQLLEPALPGAVIGSTSPACSGSSVGVRQEVGTGTDVKRMARLTAGRRAETHRLAQQRDDGCAATAERAV